MMEIPLYIADTPCVARETDGAIQVFALDQGGPNFGPRRISVSRELLDDIRRYIKEVVNANRAPGLVGTAEEVPQAISGQNLGVVTEGAQALPGV